MIPDKYSLAKCGFFYTGCGDKVACFSCGACIRDWERTDDAWKEHFKWSPSCDYIKMVGFKQGEDFPDKARTVGDGESTKNTNVSKPVSKWGFGEPFGEPFGCSKPKTPKGNSLQESSGTKTSAFHFGCSG